MAKVSSFCCRVADAVSNLIVLGVFPVAVISAVAIAH